MPLIPRSLAPTPARESNQVPNARGEIDPPTVRVPALYRAESSNPADTPPLTPAPSGNRKLSFSFSAVSTTGARNEESTGHFPRPGDTFLGFTLVEELGRGAFARVFLARQESLAGRLVALKVTLRPTREAERLARLQHTNIVPVYSIHDETPAQVICMPYLGRTTIADLIQVYRVEQSSRGIGMRNTTRLVRPSRTTAIAGNPAPSSGSPSGGYPAPTPGLMLGTESLVGDPGAVLRVLSQLADGLAHAHARGILHLDLKPANVLFADDGEPMLLDFNLSFDTTGAPRELVGGTVPYMAIEQLIDLKSRGKGKIDTRTDLYSLGVMTFEMLTGTTPFPAPPLADIEALIAARRQGAPSLRELNPLVTPAVESIVRKLLAPEPADRYQSAEDLRTDLQRHLNDLPLAVAGEPSLRERLGKWRRRNPSLPARLFAATLLGLTIGLGAVAHLRAENVAKAAAAARVRTTHAALDSLRLDLVIPGDLSTRSRGIAKAEEILASYGLPDDAGWAKRDGIRRLSEQDRTTLRDDLGELLLLLAQAKWLDAEPRTGAERREVAAAALKLNRTALDCFSPESVPAVLDRQATELATAAGEPPPAATNHDTDRQPTGRERFLEAAFAVSASRFAQALPHFERVTTEQPHHAVAQFCVAYCRQQLGQTERALERYDVAEQLMPGDPRSAYHRGVIHAMQCNHEEAEREYSKAIALGLDHAIAYRSRGFARFRLGKFKEAEADLTQAFELGAPAIQIHYYRAQVREGLKDVEGAAADRRAAAALTPKQEADYIARGMAHLEKDPNAALADFKAAEEISPRSLTALRNQVHVLADKLNRTQDALTIANRMVELHPDYATGQMARAMLLARLGRRAEAHADAEKALHLSKDAELLYRAACVYSLTSKSNPDDRTKALELLQRAVKANARGVVGIRSDRDLDLIRDSKRFQEIEQAVASLFL